MKKALSVVLCALMLMVYLFGCAAKEESKKSAEGDDNTPATINVKNQQTLSAGDSTTIALKPDGSVVYTEVKNHSGFPEKAISLDVYDRALFVLPDNTVKLVNYANIRVSSEELAAVRSWTDIVSVALGYFHSVGLKSDGTVVYGGKDDFATSELNTWTDIVAIDAGQNITIGLKADGTVVLNDEFEYTDVSTWTDIVAVSCQSGYALGLKSDGTVVATGRENNPCCKVSEWTDIVAISAGLNHAVGLKADGTVVSTVIEDEDYDWGQTDVDDWTDLVAISANYTHTVGLKSDGTVVVAGKHADNPEQIVGWDNIWIP